MINGYLQTLFNLSNNQCRLTIIYFISCVIKAVALLIISPEKFKFKLFVMLILVNMIYNIVAMKFFSD